MCIIILLVNMLLRLPLLIPRRSLRHPPRWLRWLFEESLGVDTTIQTIGQRGDRLWRIPLKTPLFGSFIPILPRHKRRNTSPLPAHKSGCDGMWPTIGKVGKGIFLLRTLDQQLQDFAFRSGVGLGFYSLSPLDRFPGCCSREQPIKRAEILFW